MAPIYDRNYAVNFGVRAMRALKGSQTQKRRDEGVRGTLSPLRKRRERMEEGPNELRQSS